jgi:hypothetical protein
MALCQHRKAQHTCEQCRDDESWPAHMIPLVRCWTVIYCGI